MLLTLGYTAGRITPGINPASKGNRTGKADNPATESRCAQGMSESEDLSFRDQNCNSGTYKPSQYSPGRGLFSPFYARKGGFSPPWRASF